MNVNINHMRMLMTGAMNRLCRELEGLIHYLPDETEIDRLVQAYDEAAAYMATLNGVYVDKEGQFTDLSSVLQVDRLSERFPREGDQEGHTEPSEVVVEKITV